MASKRALRRKVCGRKRRYDTQALALTAQCKVNAKDNWTHRMRPYRCQFCNGFHFGHVPNRGA